MPLTNWWGVTNESLVHGHFPSMPLHCILLHSFKLMNKKVRSYPVLVNFLSKKELVEFGLRVFENYYLHLRPKTQGKLALITIPLESTHVLGSHRGCDALKPEGPVDQPST